MLMLLLLLLLLVLAVVVVLLLRCSAAATAASASSAAAAAADAAPAAADAASGCLPPLRACLLACRCPYCKGARLGFGAQCTGCVRQFCNSDLPWLNNQSAIDALTSALSAAGASAPAVAESRAHPVCSMVPQVGYLPCGRGLGCDYHCGPGMWCTDDQVGR